MSLPQKNWLEWSVFALGLVLLFGTLSYLTYAGITLGDTAPQLRVELGDPSALDDLYLVPITVTNSGGAAAANVELLVELNADGTVERTNLQIDLIARGQSHEGAVFFSQDPNLASAQLRARVVAYVLP
jgi:uncharacterized protein (TIGR02588 family)